MEMDNRSAHPNSWGYKCHNVCPSHLPGENVWVALEDPGWWPARGSARGEGVRVGEMGGGSGPGDGVLLFEIFLNFFY